MASGSQAYALSDADVLAQIQSLLQQITQLQAQLALLKGSGGSVPALSPNAPSVSCLTFARSLARGSSGADVSQLQSFLSSKDYYQGARSGIFDADTESAVQGFQSERGIVSDGAPATTGWGVVGPTTRRVIHDISCSVQSASTPAPAYVAPVPVPVVPAPVPVVTTPVPTTSAPVTCQVNGLRFNEGVVKTMYTIDTVPSGGDCSAYRVYRTCLDGQFTGNPLAYYFSCSAAAAPTPLASCTVGSVTIASGATRTFYSASYPAGGTTCTSLSQARTCTNGVLSGDAAYATLSCSEVATGACVWGGTTVANGGTQTFYSTNRPALGSACSSFAQAKTCTSSVLSGDAAYIYPTCTDGLSCTTDGATIAEGASGTFYFQRTVPSSESCASYSQSRSCTSGALTGNAAYRYASCSAAASGSCSQDNVLVSSGNSQTFYSTKSAGTGTLCSSVSQSRTCTSGVLSGDAAYQYSACVDTAPCTVGSTLVAAGVSQLFYDVASVPNGSTCSTHSQVRTCTNGSLSGDTAHSNASCTVNPPTAYSGSSAQFANALTAMKAILESLSKIVGY